MTELDDDLIAEAIDYLDIILDDLAVGFGSLDREALMRRVEMIRDEALSCRHVLTHRVSLRLEHDDRQLELWSRKHTNGGYAVVWRLFNRYTAVAIDSGGLKFTEPDIAELEDAQMVADGFVQGDGHACDCPPWERVKGSRL